MPCLPVFGTPPGPSRPVTKQVARTVPTRARTNGRHCPSPARTCLPMLRRLLQIQAHEDLYCAAVQGGCKWPSAIYVAGWACCRYNPIKTIKTSFLGTMNLLGLAKRTGARFLISSTSEVGKSSFGDLLLLARKLASLLAAYQLHR